MVTKIKANSSTDDKLVEECEKKTSCGDCDPLIAWTTPSKGIRTTPPKDTLVVIVDVRSHRGAVYIYETATGEYVDGIGTEQAGNLVMVPWDSGWYYSAAGVIDVGYVAKKKSG